MPYYFRIILTHILVSLWFYHDFDKNQMQTGREETGYIFLTIHPLCSYKLHLKRTLLKNETAKQCRRNKTAKYHFSRDISGLRYDVSCFVL